MAENIPSWTPADERELARLQERKETRARMLADRVRAVAEDIHIHTMSADEVAQGIVERATEVTRVIRPFLRGPFKAMLFPAGATLGEGKRFDRIELKDWSRWAILDALDADGWVQKEFMDGLTEDEMDTQGNRLHYFETLRMDANVATVRCNTTGGYLTIVRIPEGEGEY